MGGGQLQTFNNHQVYYRYVYYFYRSTGKGGLTVNNVFSRSNDLVCLGLRYVPSRHLLPWPFSYGLVLVVTLRDEVRLELNGFLIGMFIAWSALLGPW